MVSTLGDRKALCRFWTEPHSPLARRVGVSRGLSGAGSSYLSKTCRRNTKKQYRIAAFLNVDGRSWIIRCHVIFGGLWWELNAPAIPCSFRFLANRNHHCPSSPSRIQSHAEDPFQVSMSSGYTHQACYRVLRSERVTGSRRSPDSDHASDDKGRPLEWLRGGIFHL